MKKFLVLILSIASLSAFAQVKAEDALKYVPGGSVVQTKVDEVKIRTPKGSIVEIEFTRGGTFEEASGDMIESDVFVPVGDYLPLEKVAAIVKELGYTLKGDWSYEKKFMRDWRYEVDALQNNLEYEIIVDAKTGKVLEERLDD